MRIVLFSVAPIAPTVYITFRTEYIRRASMQFQLRRKVVLHLKYRRCFETIRIPQFWVCHHK